MYSVLCSNLQMEADVIHVKSRHSQALDPHSFGSLPVIVDVVQHIVCDSALP